jgi:G3E family GTPase
VEPQRLLGTGLFELTEAERHPGWLQEARVGDHTPESAEYGISSITFRSRLPFNASRFRELTTIMETMETMETRAELLVTAEPEVEGQPKEAGRRLSRSSTVTEGGLCAALRVVRAKGLVWVASQQSHCYMGMASLAGRRFDVTYGAMWHAARVDSSRSASQPWPNLSPGFHTHWEEPWGDRRTELVVRRCVACLDGRPPR